MPTNTKKQSNPEAALSTTALLCCFGLLTLKHHPFSIMIQISFFYYVKLQLHASTPARSVQKKIDNRIERYIVYYNHLIAAA